MSKITENKKLVNALMDEAKSLIVDLRKGQKSLRGWRSRTKQSREIASPLARDDNAQLIKDLYRAAHTLIGVSATVERHKLAECARAMAQILKDVRDG